MFTPVPRDCCRNSEVLSIVTFPHARCHLSLVRYLLARQLSALLHRSHMPPLGLLLRRFSISLYGSSARNQGEESIHFENTS